MTILHNDEEIHQLLATGNLALPNRLEKEAMKEAVSDEDILNATSLPELKERIRRKEEIEALCHEASEFL